MTTIYVNITKGTVYSDSRCTTERVNTELLTFMNFCLKKTTTKKIVSFQKTKKIYAINGSAVVTVGDTEVSDHLKALFEGGKNPCKHTIPGCFKEKDGKVLIVRPGYVISIRIKDGQWERNVYFADNLTSGSGAGRGFLKHAQHYLWQYTEEQIFKVLRLSSLFDVYSDDNIVCMKPDEYKSI